MGGRPPRPSVSVAKAKGAGGGTRTVVMFAGQEMPASVPNDGC
jgi:hypothetical protein